jgi:carbon monoxide dehydrogenase subunit G
MMGGTSWQVIDATPDVLWQALLDTSHFSRMLPQVDKAHLVRSAGDKMRMFVRHRGTLVETSYFLDVKLAPDHSGMTFRVDESSAKGIHAAWGYYSLRPYAGGKTLLIYGVMADIGDGLVAMLLRSTVHEWLLKVPWMVKRFVEGSGRYIYKTRKI